MSTELATSDLDVRELFDENGELRLYEDESGWTGYLLEEGEFFHVDSFRVDFDLFEKCRVGERAVRLAVQEYVASMTGEQQALACLAYLPDPSDAERGVSGP